MTPTTIALSIYVAWTMVLVLLVIGYRSASVLRGIRPANDFPAARQHEGAQWYQRAMRAHLNCVENLGLFVTIAFVAIVTGNGAITDQIAYIVVGGRVAQSTIHLISESSLAVMARLAALMVQYAAIGYALAMLLQQAFGEYTL